ncbi:adenylate/guanylate cyclase domain-containing protein [Methylobacterium organophilum]|uniref:adenylate/guanylate cyclase domain-containing protein n=1 Tax=Methylobacterium organophilum TaxID=410 RepID=UPI001F131019|nr:adenylate/guanylate cyclase domain-containing protein [Methylobacterium organophilum]UMY19244.1 adenylate/guanylate cyclase domain-containing protein [Methylobacterium organophilum]
MSPEARSASTDREGETHAERLLQGAAGSRLIAMHALVVVVLLAMAQSYDGSVHGLSHWAVLGAYAVCSIGLALADRWERRLDALGVGHAGRTEWLAWASTLLNAAVVIYVEVEHMLAGVVAGSDDAATAVSRLPAFLLLLQTALSMRVWHTLVFSGAVALAWGGALLVASLRGSLLGPHVTLTEEVSGLLAFCAASFVVVDGVRRLRRAVGTALGLERERSLLARFVPGSVAARLAEEGGLGTPRLRHACLLALDIRGFSAMSRARPQPEVVEALLGVRALVHGAVTEQGGIVDKYVGDGILAQFVVGSVERQMTGALACARTIEARLARLNGDRERQGLPPLRVTIALHAGDVLVGVFDDGFRAEYTVLGPAMNLLARLESRAKAADLTLAASEDFARLLQAEQAAGVRRVTTAPGDEIALYAIEDGRP